MSQVFVDVLVSVISATILTLLSFVGTKLCTLIDNKVKDTKGNALLKQATTIVVDAVRATFQTYVESLKNSGSFNKDAQLIALNKAKDTVLSQLTTEVKDYITTNFGDLSNWITNQIESSINLLKNS